VLGPLVEVTVELPPDDVGPDEEGTDEFDNDEGPDEVGPDGELEVWLEVEVAEPVAGPLILVEAPLLIEALLL